MRFFFVLLKISVFRLCYIPSKWDITKDVQNKNSFSLVRAQAPFHFNAFVKKVWYAWPVSSTVYNQEKSFLTRGSCCNNQPFKYKIFNKVFQYILES